MPTKERTVGDLNLRQDIIFYQRGRCRPIRGRDEAMSMQTKGEYQKYIDMIARGSGGVSCEENCLSFPLFAFSMSYEVFLVSRVMGPIDSNSSALCSPYVKRS